MICEISLCRIINCNSLCSDNTSDVCFEIAAQAYSGQEPSSGVLDFTWFFIVWSGFSLKTDLVKFSTGPDLVLKTDLVNFQLVEIAGFRRI